jgi:hypothetical protein
MPLFVGVGGVVVVAAFALAVLLAVGFGSRISADNYKLLKKGMSRAQVEAILGSGVAVSSASVDVPGGSFSLPGAGSASFPGISTSAEVLFWKNGTRSIMVEFVNDKLFAIAQFGLEGTESCTDCSVVRAARLRN